MIEKCFASLSDLPLDCKLQDMKHLADHECHLVNMSVKKILLIIISISDRLILGRYTNFIEGHGLANEVIWKHFFQSSRISIPIFHTFIFIFNLNPFTLMNDFTSFSVSKGLVL